MDTDNARQAARATEVSAHQEQTRRLVRAMMRLTGQTASGLARAAGLTPSTVNRFMHKPVRHTLSQRTMLALMTETFQAVKGRSPRSLDAEALGELSPALAVYEKGILAQAPDLRPMLSELKTSVALQREPSVESVSGVDLPVLTASTHGVNVQNADFMRAPLKTQRPPFLDSDPKAFAILMPDETMMPRFDAGDMLYVSPARGLKGDKVDVVIERAAGGFAVFSLAGLNGDTVRIATLSPRTRETLGRDKVRGIYRIVGVQRLGA